MLPTTSAVAIQKPSFRAGRRRSPGAAATRALQAEGEPLPHADAEADERATGPAAPHLQEGGRREPRPARAEGVAERDRPSVRVHEVRVVGEAERPRAGQHLRGERLVDLDDVVVGESARPAAPGACGSPAPGPRPMVRGGTPALAIPVTRASGSRPKRAAAASEARRSAPAPSLMPEAFPAVIVVPGPRRGFRRARSSRVVPGRGCSSRSTTRASLPAFTGTGTISSASQPFARAALGALLAPQRVGVLVLARDPVLAGQVLRRLGHRVDPVPRLDHRVHEAPAERRVLELLVPAEGRAGLPQHVGRAGHALDPPGQHQLRLAEADGARRLADGLEPGRAEPVDGDAGHRVRQAGEEHGHAGDVPVVLAGLVGAAEDHLVERAPVHAREPLHQRGDRHRREVVGPDGARAPPCRPNGVRTAAQTKASSWERQTVGRGPAESSR